MPPLNFFDPYYWSIHVPLLIFLGACFGSFFNVCIYRIPRGVPLAMPPSHCYRCGSRVAWHDNIPLLSYWILRGRCRRCDAPFSMRYFLIELLTMLLFAIVALKIGYSLALIPALAFTSMLIIATFTDIDHWIIPDRVSLGGLTAGLALAAIPPVGGAAGNPLAASLFFEALPEALRPLADSAAGAAVGFGGLWVIGYLGSLIFRKEAMGFGDVKLFGMFGAFCGLEPLPYILLIACLVGTFVGLAGIVADKLSTAKPPAATAPLKLEAPAIERMLNEAALDEREREVIRPMLEKPGPVGSVRHHLPFGPSLAVAAWLGYLFHAQISMTLNAWVLRMSEAVWGA